MILSKQTIQQYMTVGYIEIEPFNPAQLKANSYDVTLGNWFYQVVNEGGERVYYGPKWYDDGEKVPIHFGVGLLGMTKAYIATRGNLIGQLRAKSTTGREFWTVCQDAGFGDIGYRGHWTAEFSSHLLGTTSITVGQAFGQIVFHLTTTATEEYSGQYQAVEFPACMVPKKYRDKVQPWEDAPVASPEVLEAYRAWKAGEIQAVPWAEAKQRLRGEA